MKFAIKIFLSLFLIIGTVAYAADTASILPPAKTTFVDQNGKPLTSGKVFFYIPSTTTFKTTWQDAAETISNTNPVILDAAGRALILGSGSYRQLVKDRLDNIIWDQITSSSGSGGSTPAATGDGDLVGTIKPWAGITAPNQYMLTYGQEVSRTTYSMLFTAITSTQAVFCSSGSAILNGLSDTTFIPLGASVEVSCIAAGNSTVISKTATSITLAVNANISTNANAVILPWGGGNHTTTFNLPDYRGIVPAGNNNMGGVASSNLATFGYANSPTVSDPNSIGAYGGNQLSILSTLNFPAYTPSGVVANGAITSTFTGISGQTGLSGAGGSQAYTAGGFASSQIGGTVVSTQATSTFTGTPQGGTNAPFSRMQPTKTINYVIKVTPDTNSATASGVTLLGGMSGDIACGSGISCSGNIISLGIGVPVTVPNGGTSLSSLTANNVLIGNGSLPIQFAAPSAVQGCLSSTGASSPPSFGSTSASQCGPVTYVNTIAGLRTLTAGVTPNAFSLGYYANGDGGGGNFYWDASSSATDDGGTVIQPNSLPATGRWLRFVSGSDYNVRWFGTKGDGTTDDHDAFNRAMLKAISVKGAMYIPTASSYYFLGSSSLIIPDNTSGLRIHGDTHGSSVPGSMGSLIITTASSVIDMTAVASGGTGSINNITIENIQISATGSSTKTLKVWNVDNFVANNLIITAGQGCALDMAGTAHFYTYNLTLYANGGSPICVTQNAVGSQNIGPGAFTDTHISINNDIFPALNMANDPLGVEFIGLDIQWSNSTGAAAVELNGGGSPTVGSLIITTSHSESTFNTTNTGKTIRVGNVTSFGNLIINGGNFWGQGDGTNYLQDWLQVVAANSVTVNNSVTSKLGSTNGFSRSMIRFETTFTGAYSIKTPIASTISGSLYSDANSRCSGTNSCQFGGQIFDTLTLGTPLVATSGGTGFASYAIGDLLYANTTTTLAKLADVTTTNALISGGVGVAPSWGKIGNSTLTNSSTTVNGITCTLGSTCTVTAAATGVTVGTTTITSGTSHGVLTNNTGVLGNTAIGTNGQIFLGVTSAEPNWGTMSGDATITNAGVVTFASTIAAGGPIGSATVTPIITYDAKGRLTTVSSTTIAPAASSITSGAALSKVDDTNVTLTLGGSPTTALLAATSITAGWTGTLANARLASMATNTVKGNATSGSASPTDLSMTSCSTAASAVIWTTNTGFGCNTSITANSATTATTATNATNGATVAISTNASFFPLFAASSSNSNQPFNLDTTFTYNPSTDTLTATTFAGNATTATTATNTAITDDTTTNAIMYPTWVTTTTGNLPQKISSTLMTWNPSTPQLKIGAGADTPIVSGALVYATNNGTSNIVVRDSTNDVELNMQAASFGGLVGTVTSSPLLIRTNNANQLTISSAGVFTFNTIPAADTATTDNTLCVSTTGIILKGSGTLGICLGTSSARYKHDILNMGLGLEDIIKLTPKYFYYNEGFGDTNKKQLGFIAEDVINHIPDLVGLDTEGKPNSVDMVAMIPIMVNAIKELKTENDNLRTCQSNWKCRIFGVK